MSPLPTKAICKGYCKSTLTKRSIFFLFLQAFCIAILRICEIIRNIINKASVYEEVSTALLLKIGGRFMSIIFFSIKMEYVFCFVECAGRFSTNDLRFQIGIASLGYANFRFVISFCYCVSLTLSFRMN